MSRDTRTTSWVFTLNNYTAGEFETLKQALAYGTYAIIGEEVASTGTPHLQGYVYWGRTAKKSFKQMKKLLGERAHFEPAKGDSEQNKTYCSKDGKFWEHGTCPPTPKRQREQAGEANAERWELARNAAKEGRWDDVPADIYIRHYSNIKKIGAEAQEIPQSVDDLNFWWFCGPSGAGKSTAARAENPDHYLKLPNKWWDGYKAQPCVIIDEWSPNHSVLGDHLKRWCDHHPFAAEIKGGTICIRPPKVVITSNFTIEECFPGKDCEPLRRRFTVRLFPE